MSIIPGASGTPAQMPDGFTSYTSAAVIDSGAGAVTGGTATVKLKRFNKHISGRMGLVGVTTTGTVAVVGPTSFALRFRPTVFTQLGVFPNNGDALYPMYLNTSGDLQLGRITFGGVAANYAAGPANYPGNPDAYAFSFVQD